MRSPARGAAGGHKVPPRTLLKLFAAILIVGSTFHIGGTTFPHLLDRVAGSWGLDWSVSGDVARMRSLEPTLFHSSTIRKKKGPKSTGLKEDGPGFAQQIGWTERLLSGSISEDHRPAGATVALNSIPPAVRLLLKKLAQAEAPDVPLSGLPQKCDVTKPGMRWHREIHVQPRL